MPVEFARQLYLLLLLRLPVLYFSRVSRLIEDANLSMVDIRRMATAHADQWNDGTPGSWPTTYLPESALLSPRLHNFKHSWEALIDSLSREWKTQNVVSALMLTCVFRFQSKISLQRVRRRAILTVLQIDAAASDPITRTTALLSLIFALMSLIFGSMYLMIFGAMRKMYRAANWAAETLNDHPPTLWNVWILVALPAVWLVWSIVLFVTCIMAFAWRTGASTDHIHAGISHNAAEGLRIGVSAILALALIYFALVVKTLGEFGNKDREWRDQMKQAQGYLDPEAGVHAPLPHHHSHMPPRSFDDTRLHSSRSSTPATDPPRGRRPSRPALQIPSPGPFRSTAATASFNRPADLRADSRKADATFPAAKVIDLQTDKSSSPRTYPLPTLLQTHRDILPPDWGQFTRDLEEVWAGRENDTVGPPPAFEAGAGTREWGLARLMHLWNTHFFRPRFAEAVLRKEEPGFSVYLTPVPPMTEDSSPPQPDHDELKSSRPAVQLQRGSNHLQDVNRDPQGSGMTVLDSSWRTILPASQPPQQIPSAADSSQDLSIPLRASPV
ncbi:hypothetical protein C8R46DRAFT_1343769 [Mycena filopes]|nr:hypothetical protein C8R46DRAFT_1343769 [Mycena filopes]